jgi:hypothetical protein
MMTDGDGGPRVVPPVVDVMIDPGNRLPPAKRGMTSTPPRSAIHVRLGRHARGSGGVRSSSREPGDGRVGCRTAVRTVPTAAWMKESGTFSGLAGNGKQSSPTSIWKPEDRPLLVGGRSRSTEQNPGLFPTKQTGCEEEETKLWCPDGLGVAGWRGGCVDRGPLPPRNV